MPPVANPPFRGCQLVVYQGCISLWFSIQHIVTDVQQVRLANSEEINRYVAINTKK